MCAPMNEKGVFRMTGKDFLNEYVKELQIDAFALPVQMSRCAGFVLVDAPSFADASGNLKSAGLLVQRRGEDYYRLREKYSAVWMIPILRGLVVGRYDLPLIRRVGDIPPHMGMQARGFELEVAARLGGEHLGDKYSSIDVLLRDGRRIECKYGNGIFMTQRRVIELTGGENDD